MSDEKENLKIENEHLKKQINKLKEEINYLKQIKDALDKTTIISKTDPDGIITDVNPMFEKISGYTKEELIGKPHNIVRHPDMPKAVFKKLWDTIQKGKIFKGVIKNRKKDGGEYYVLANIIPIKNEKGEIVEYIAIRQDITKRMQLQSEKEKFSNSLIEYFLRKLKDPAFIIDKYSALIMKETEKRDVEKIKTYNLKIRKQALVLKRSYTVLFYILKFRKKEIKINKETVKITKILQYLFHKFYKIYDKKIKFKIHNKNLTVQTDKILFGLMCEILFMNALIHAKKQVVIHLFSENTKPFLIFENDGEEIKEKEKVFDFFNQIKTNKNTGMGMYLVKKICNLFGYEIKIEGKKIILKLN